MWIKLNLDGIDFHFRISQYEKSTQERWDVQWCSVDLTLQCTNCLDYKISSEILLSCEVEDIRDNINRLLHNEIQDISELDFIEPDLTFVLIPKKDTGHEILNVAANMHIHLWDDGLTENYISVCFDRDNLKRLLTYLQFITGEISKNSDAVQELVSNDVFRIH